MNFEPDRLGENIEEIATRSHAKPVTEELSKLKEALKSEFPKAVWIEFEFRQQLRIHIDVRTIEEVTLIEARLPALCGGAFSGVFSGRTPNHAFLHRVTASVDR
ncbi:hypothetical protein P7228_09160 [Altererythrobacter arenosus]|uniref:Uncharacterized protein n=1 Tax=Altererythrobacter arenosus TaxID=3032592 RepID=A0ABY8FMB8_9SPHN|nr:hypothetical protein [Altererythrobacter sp. CAU 1644]WFL76169.1 hypothetical protein P7228_09160 [Altererythrobacter sp. CAU 1644]